jgi:hypothetical protein
MLTVKKFGCIMTLRKLNGEKRHADTNHNTVLIAKIATDELEDVTTKDGLAVRATIKLRH